MGNVTNLLAEGEWWRIFGNDPKIAVFLLICAIPFIIVPIVFVVGAIRSVATSVKTLATPKAVSLDAGLPREQRNAKLTTTISPPQEFVIGQGELKGDEIGRSGLGGVLDAFERSVILSPDPDMSLAKIKGGNAQRDSFLIVYRASATIHFLGWITVHQTGITSNWKIRAAEVRAVRSPDEGNSHFNYDRTHDQTLFNAVFKRKDDESGLGAVWDLATGNILTEGMAKKAAWFRGYLHERLQDALTEVFESSAASRPGKPSPAQAPPPGTTSAPTQPPKGRPTRRD